VTVLGDSFGRGGCCATTDPSRAKTAAASVVNINLAMMTPSAN
jgi:hypothetical protein